MQQFRPNPDAKPFIPNPLTVAATKWHFYSNENGKVSSLFLVFFLSLRTCIKKHVEPESDLLTGFISVTDLDEALYLFFVWLKFLK